MDDNERKFKLDFIRDRFIEELLRTRIHNTRLSVTFTRNSPNSGDAVFKDNYSHKITKASWIASKTTESIIVALLYGNELLAFEEEYYNFINKLNNSLVM